MRIATAPPATTFLAAVGGLEQSCCSHEPMICEHLKPLEEAIQAKGIRETFRGKAWSMNCREWVYFDCYLDLDVIRAQFPLEACVHDHIHRGTHDGEERGLVCGTCHDAVVGAYDKRPGRTVFPS